MMDEAELMRIVVEEGLDAPVMFGAGRRVPDAVVLERDGGARKVYVSDERAWPHTTTIRVFDDESDAWEHVLLKLRQKKKVDHSMAQRRLQGEQSGGTQP
jgi:hypothetical protein